MSNRGQVYIEELSAHVGDSVTLRGWLHNRRSSGKLAFLIFRDGTGFMQAVLSKSDVSEEVWERSKTLTQESAIELRGLVREEPRAPGGYELTVEELVLHHLAEDYPITPKEHGTSFLLDHRHLWLRSKRQHAILRIRNEVIVAARRFLDGRGFLCSDTPIFTPNACEGTTTLFETRYFDQSAFLSQSGQLYNEAIAMAVGKTYCFGPTFRAEKSKTRRHLIEFWMIEPEVAYAELQDTVELAEDLICAIVESVLGRRKAELDVLERDVSPLEAVGKPFYRMTYDEAAKKLADKTGFEPGNDFGAQDETALVEELDRPLAVTHYPTSVKAFYMQPDADRPDRVLCVDILAPEGYGEIVGGGQRIHDLELLRARLKEHGLPEKDFQWYLDLRRFGSVPHSGFGMGIERLVSWICKLDHLREAIPFPRMLYRLSP
ncbi:MAG TPA: asparagine--tRNA ligase [Vicinamibacteria bacterium]|nr:asparagine--tRNA ligase [Vicinamibacteria bacterium]